MGNLTRKCLAESRQRGVPSKSFYGRNYVVSKFPSSCCNTSYLLFAKMKNQGKWLKSEILGPQKNVSCSRWNWHHDTYIENNHWFKLFVELFWDVNDVLNAFKVSNTFSVFTRGGQRLTCPFGDKGPLVMCSKSVCKGWQQATVIIGRNIYWCHHRQASITFYFATVAFRLKRRVDTSQWLLTCYPLFAERWGLVREKSCFEVLRWFTAAAILHLSSQVPYLTLRLGQGL